MNKKMNKLLIITTAFLVLVNVIVLAGVSYNRSGEINSGLQLTERELSLPYLSYRQKENSGLALKLNWGIVPEEPFKNSYNKYARQRYGTPNWLTEDKLKELGFNIDSTKLYINDSLFDNGKSQTEEIIVVLEYNGQTFQDLLNNAEKDIQILRNRIKNHPDDKDLMEQISRDEGSLMKLKTSESRLIAIDAGRNLQVLNEKYTNSSKYLMMRGEMRCYWTKEGLSASINGLFIPDIHVALPYTKEINKFTNHVAIDKKNYSWNGKPRYRVELNVGMRLEPWIIGVSGL